VCRAFSHRKCDISVDPVSAEFYAEDYITQRGEVSMTGHHVISMIARFQEAAEESDRGHYFPEALDLP
jgi:hypothetical protein